jgi:hypothetical protein
MLVEKIDAYAGEEIILINGVYILRTGNRTAKFNINSTKASLSNRG